MHWHRAPVPLPPQRVSGLSVWRSCLTLWLPFFPPLLFLLSLLSPSFTLSLHCPSFTPPRTATPLLFGFPLLQPSHGDKTSHPEVLKWMNDLAKGRKQLKGECLFSQTATGHHSIMSGAVVNLFHLSLPELWFPASSGTLSEMTAPGSPHHSDPLNKPPTRETWDLQPTCGVLTSLVTRLWEAEVALRSHPATAALPG